MPRQKQTIDYNSIEFQFPNLSKSSYIFKQGYLRRELLPIVPNQERLVNYYFNHYLILICIIY